MRADGPPLGAQDPLWPEKKNAYGPHALKIISQNRCPPLT